MRRLRTIFGGALLLAMTAAANAQDSAQWFGGTGNWSNASLWVCQNENGPCVPSGNFLVGASAGTITLDINETVAGFNGTGSTVLKLNGTSLTVNGNGSVARLEADGGLVLNAGASVNTTTLSTFLGGGTSFFQSSTLTTNSLSVDGMVGTPSRTSPRPAAR